MPTVVMSTPYRYTPRLVVTLALFTCTFGVQLLGLPQFITGSFVNASLFAGTFLAGPAYAIAMGLMTPIIAYTRGILPAPLLPMIPFIALGNVILVGTFYAMRTRMGWPLQVALAATVKFLLLAIAVQFVVNVPAPIVTAMQWPQLFTALMGGYIAAAINTTGWRKHVA